MTTQVDNATAGILLSSITKGGSPNFINDFHKSLVNNSTANGPSKEQLEYLVPHVGEACRITGTDMLGIFKRINTSEYGLYPGGRYPIYVIITHDDRDDEYNTIGNTYEYGCDSVQWKGVTPELAFGEYLFTYLNEEACEKFRTWQKRYSSYDYLSPDDSIRDKMLEGVETYNDNDLLEYYNLVEKVHSLLF